MTAFSLVQRNQLSGPLEALEANKGAAHVWRLVFPGVGDLHNIDSFICLQCFYVLV